MPRNQCQRSVIYLSNILVMNNFAFKEEQCRKAQMERTRFAVVRSEADECWKINECNDVLGNESSGNIASAICSTEKILRRGGDVSRKRKRERESVSLIRHRHYASQSYRLASNVCSFSCLLQFQALLSDPRLRLCVINHHK